MKFKTPMPQLQIIVYFLLRVKEVREGVMGRLGKEDRRKWAIRKVGQEDKQKKGLRERMSMGGVGGKEDREREFALSYEEIGKGFKGEI